MYSAEVLAHSKSEAGAEAITFRVVMPRIMLAEFNTHRKFGSNTSSSRAIPNKKMIAHARENIFTPIYWGANQSGMQAQKELYGFKRKAAEFTWGLAGKLARGMAYTLDFIGVHKQITNRLIENFTYVTVIFTTTDIQNFLALRYHKDAQPEIHELARHVYAAYNGSTATLLKKGEWHLPLITKEDLEAYTLEECKLISGARCASTSFVTVDGKPITPRVAQNIAYKLVGSQPIHASPFEHQLTPDDLVDIEYRVTGTKKLKSAKVWANPNLHGNTVGFQQYRKMLPGESYATDLNYYLLPN